MQQNVMAKAAALAAVVSLVACGGGGGSTGGGGNPVPVPTASMPPGTPTPGPTATPAPPGASSQTIVTSAGGTSGQSGQFQNYEGDTPTGGQGASVDGVTCDPAMSNIYHIHSFLGVYVNGTLMALPAGIGMENAQPPQNGFVDAASCFYHLHTHDQSGLIHVEDPDPSNIPTTQSMYNLKTFLDIWGITADSNHFGPFTGPVRVFTSGAVYRGNNASYTTTADTLTFYGTDPNSVPLYSHEAIFIEVGPTYPSSLPNVKFYEAQ
ncbi:MAG TPA: hypothetical protein VFN49_00755 [Candidatus Aquilonibacter sp.]|nr:hypothetical protein [Candidatus Aquilonibacter sp.]